MNSFICLQCQKTFKRRYNLDRHYQRKNSCKPVNNLGVSQNVIQNTSNVIQNVIQNTPSVIQNVIPNNTTNPNNTNNTNNFNNLNNTNNTNIATIPTIYRCDYCDKDYKYRQGLCKHRLK